MFLQTCRNAWTRVALAAALVATLPTLSMAQLDAADFTAAGLDSASMVTFATTVLLPMFAVFFLLGLAYMWFRRSRR